MIDKNTFSASYREMLLEHLFVGEIMRHLWLRDITQFEVLKPQVDDSGYDLVLEANSFVRHVQLKTSAIAAKTGEVHASLKLAAKPSGCLIWILFDPKTMNFAEFRWFGAAPGLPMPDISKLRIAKHVRGDKTGTKPERPGHRVIPRAKFETVNGIEKLVSLLFGTMPMTTSAA